MKERERITNRDLFIARGLALGDSVGELAHHLGIKPQSVRRYISDLYRLTGAGTQAGLAGWAMVNGAVTIDELRQVFGSGGMDREREL